MTVYHAFKNSFKNRLGARVHKFIVKYIRVTQDGGHGCITLHCKPLWEMTNEQFEELFGVKIKEKVIGEDEKNKEVKRKERSKT